MAYTSKYFTCEEIDERLLQGYYDDFVKAGFLGTISEFHQYVLSIKNKVDKGELDSALETLKELSQKLDALGEATEGIPTKVSQLENDLKFTTKDEVEDYIDRLVGGASQALDTLLELGNALNNDPNFASNITNLITNLQKDLDKEIERAKEQEATLTTNLREEIAKRENADNELRELISSQMGSLQQTYTESLNALSLKVDKFNDRLLTIQTSVGELSTKLATEVNRLESSIHEVEDSVGTKVSELKETLSGNLGELSQRIAQESLDRLNKDQEILSALSDHTIEYNTKFNELSKEVNDFETQLALEASTRQTEDAKLQSAINEESTNRLTDKSEVLAKLSEEVTNRTNDVQNLKEKINTETSLREGAINSVNTKIDNEAITRQNEDNLIKASIENNKTLTDAEINKVSNDLASEVSRAKEAENNKVDKKEGYGLSKNDFTDELFNKLYGIQANANYISKVSELINDEGYQTKEEVEAAIQKVIDLAPDTLNTLKELADALGNDPNFATSITTKIAQLGTQINQEVQDRKEADNNIKEAYAQAIQSAVVTLQASITTLEGTVNNNYRELSTNVDNLEGSVDTLATTFEEYKNEVVNKIAEVRTYVTEQLNSFNIAFSDFKGSVNTSLLNQDSKISANTAAIQANLELIQALQKQFSDQSGDYSSLVNAEASIRKADDDALKSRCDLLDQQIIQETSTRESEISRVETLLENKEIEINNSIQEVSTNLESEVIRATQKENELEAKITQLQQDKETLEGQLQAALQRIANLETAVTNIIYMPVEDIENMFNN